VLNFFRISINKKFVIGQFVLMVWVLCAPTIYADDAQEPIQELFKSDMVFPQEEGEIQLTFAPQYNEADDGTSWELPIAVEYGITDNLQVELEWISYAHNNPDDEGTSSGIGDAEIGLQYSWMNISDSSVHAAVGVEVGLPFGDDEKDLGEGEKSLGSYFILGVDIVEQVHTFLQVGVEKPESEDREDFVNVGLIIAASDVAAFTLEYNWEEEAAYVTPGFVWTSIDSWELGLGVPVGVADDADDFQVILHVILELDG